MKRLNFLLVILSLLLLASCGGSSSNSEFSLPYEKYELENGLQVVLHQDSSDPIVSVAIKYHVGSSREKLGKTGFAHFFEHMLFQRSENLPRNAFFTKINELGGSFNGFTTQQGTCYFETVPRDALEKILWMESDRMGFFINTVTEGGLRREIDVVSNEKRQGENRPYGHLNALTLSNFYPEGHPYSWTVIGEIPDLRSATIEDVKEFYSEYYVPANATLVVSGDFDNKTTKELIEKYFGEITKKPAPAPLPIQRVTLEQNKSILYSDSYASSPLLAINYSTTETYHKDEYAIDLLTMLLAGDSSSPLYNRLVMEKGLASSVSMSNSTQEIAGLSSIYAIALDGVSLDDIYREIDSVIAEFGENGADQSELDRYKTMLETSIYQEVISTEDKAIGMAMSNTFSSRPDQIVENLKQYKAVTVEDIMRVYNQYFKDAKKLIISTVPIGMEALSVAGSTAVFVEQESIEEQEMQSESGEIVDDPYEMSPSKIDRSKEPALMANTPKITAPKIWNSKVGDIQVRGIHYDELPLVSFSIILGQGMLKDPADKVGTSYLTASLMNEGTEFKTPDELTAAIGNLGAEISVSSSTSVMEISGSSLVSKFPEVMALVEEMILHPRWDEESFEVEKAKTLQSIDYNATLPSSIASKVMRKALYGSENIESNSVMGSRESIESITIDDLKSYYKANISPKSAKLNVVGNLTSSDVESAISSLSSKWKGQEVAPYIYAKEYPKKSADILFVDYPEARQSYILIGGHSVGIKDHNAYPLTVVNTRLGESSSGELFKVLRLEYGYTYGAYSQFAQGEKGLFFAQSSVQATVTKESLELFKQVLNSYGDKFDQEMLDATVATLKAQSYGSYETPRSLSGILDAVSIYGLSDDFISEREAVLDNITLEQAKELIAEHINLKNMTIVVVGDKATQLEAVKAAGLGNVVVVEAI